MNLFINSTFKPVTLDDRLKPLLIYQQAYQEQEDALAELESQANVWEKLADSAQDEDVYNQYKAYANSVRHQAASIARQGLTPGSRKAMLDLKARYNRDIDPIEKAWTERDRQMKLQQEIMAKDPTHMFKTRANEVGLKNYMTGQYDALTDSYSGALLTSQVATIAEALAKEARDSDSGKANLKKILPYTYEMAKEYGFSRDAVMNAIMRSPNANEILMGIVDSVIDSSGIRKWNNPEMLERAYQYASQGLYKAIGETKYQIVQDEAGLAAYKHSLANPPTQPAKPNINPVNKYSSRKLSKDEKEWKDNVNNLSQYFEKDKNGRYILTDEGRKEYNKTYQREVTTGYGPSGGGSGPGYRKTKVITESSPLKKLLDSLGFDGNFTSPYYDRPGSLWEEYISESPISKTAIYDATKSTEYDYPIAESDRNLWKSNILDMLQGADLNEVDWDDENKQWVPTGNTITTKSLNSSDYTPTRARFDEYGSTVFIRNKDGVVSRYEMPVGISPTNEENRDKAMKAASYYRDIVNSGMYINGRGQLVQASPEEIEVAKQFSEFYKAQGQLFEGQIITSNKSEPIKQKPIGY